MFQAGKEYGQRGQERTVHAMELISTAIPILGGLAKDHKSLQDNGDPKTRPVCVFYDDGCSHSMFKEGVPGVELDGVITRKGPFAISAAGNSQVKVNHEWSVLMEKNDGSKQVVVGVSADQLTSEFPLVNVTEAHKDILNKAPRFKRQKLNQLKWI